MASINELINLSRYQSGDLGRASVQNVQRTDPLDRKAKQLRLQQMALQIKAEQDQQEINKKMWENFGNNDANRNKTTPGVVENLVDNPDAVSVRDAAVVGDYKMKPMVSRGGDWQLKPDNSVSTTKPLKYDRVKVVDRAMKMVNANLAELGIDKGTMKASDYSERLKMAIPEAEKYLGFDGLAPSKADMPKQDTRPINPSGVTFSPEDFLPQYKEKRGMIEVAKDFYFGGNKNKSQQQVQEGQTATNPKTGKRIIYKGGQWVAIN